jgi:hypothetical protein
MSHRVVLGDCLDPVTGLASLADGSVDHVICDPPYTERVHANSRRNNAIGEAAAEPVGIDFGFAALDERTLAESASHVARVTRRWALVFCAAEHITDWQDALVCGGMEAVRVGVWVKVAPAPQFTGDRPASGVEHLVIAHPAGKKRWNGGGRAAVWTAGVIGKDHVRHHTAQKPLALMESLLRDFTDPGELILDPFAGSGTTGVAAKRLGRRFLGWERDPKYHAIAERRIRDAREQMTIPLARSPKPKQDSLDLSRAASGGGEAA